MRIFLVRHGRSTANEDNAVHLQTADHAIPLSEQGKRQAAAAGLFLYEYYLKYPALTKTRIWHSPYVRARQTADAIEHNMKQHTHLEVDRREHLLLAEQQFGLFDGLSSDGARIELERKYPDEFEHYEKCKKFGGAFWARMPLGESKFDLSTRVHQAFGTFHRDAVGHNIQNIIVVAHGTTNRAFMMMWMHYGYEWFEREKNPANCSIRLIEEGVDRGYIFTPQE